MRLIFWVCCVLLFVFFSPDLDWRAKAQAQQNDPQRQSDGGESDAPKPLFGVPIIIVEDEAKAESRNNREELRDQREIQDLLAQQGMNEATQSIERSTFIMLWISCISLVFVAVGTAFLGFNLRLLRQANDAAQDAVWVTREIGQAQVKAYLTIQKVELRHIRRNESKRKWGLRVYVRNAGQSPARQVRLYVITHKFDIDVIGVAPDIGAGEDAILTTTFETTDEAIGWDKPSAPSFRARVKVQIRYNDIFFATNGFSYLTGTFLLDLVSGASSMNLIDTGDSEEGYDPNVYQKKRNER